MNQNKGHGLLALVRHGESVWNQKGLWTGWTDIPLTKKGEEEAIKAATSLAGIQFDQYFSSELSRAVQTIEIMFGRLNLQRSNYTKIHDFKERHYGIYTGKNKWEIKKKVGESKFNKLRRGWDEPIPNGETLKDVFQRVIPRFQKDIWPLILNGKKILLVAHGNTHRAIIKHLEQVPDEKISEIEMETGEVIVYYFNQKGIIISKEKKHINV